MRLAILFGGISYEHEISIVSAITMKKVLKEEDPLFLFLDFKREFYLIPSEKMEAKTFSSGDYRKERVVKPIVGGFGYSSLFGGEKFQNLKVINLVHGATGEDGTIYSILDFYNIETISPRREASTISFSKELTKIYANSLDIKTLPYEVINIAGKRELKELQYPVIVKPLTLGSSLGVSVVESEDEFDYALDSAFEYDRDVIVEPFIADVEEYNIAGTYTTRLTISNIEKPEKGKVLDFETKYLDFSRSETVKAPEIDKELRKDIIEAFSKIYSSIFHGSLIRCDFFLIDGEVYLNEINSIPGSMANYLFSDFVEVIKAIQIPEKHVIPPSYQYINSIQKVKGN
jgi:D-alanine-D-alanine ligase